MSEVIRKIIRKIIFESNLNDNFKTWFSGSKVVDENGEPIVVHHGTSKKFSKFSLKNAPQPIIWFTSNKSTIEAGEAGAQGKGHIMDLYVSIKNPAGWNEYEKYGLGQLESMGYDGAILPDPDGTFTGFVFKSSQLKSIKNKGEWDYNNKNILKEEESKFSDDYDLSKHNFNIGDCDIYAVSLHRLYGYPLYVVRGWFLEPEWGGKRGLDYEDSHICVKLPDGNYMDSNGKTSKSELKKNSVFSNEIQKITIEPIDEETALNTFSCQNQEFDIKKIMNYIESKKKLNESARWNQGGIILIKGEKLKNGKQKLYANIPKQIIEAKSGTQTTHEIEKFVLGKDFYRIRYNDKGDLKAFLVERPNSIGIDKNTNIVYKNENKIPLHWETLKFNNIGTMIRSMDSQILQIDNIEFFN